MPVLETPKTVGEHIKHVRLLRGLSQPKVAAHIGVDTATVLNWEKNRTEPPVATIPAILRFLGYDPYPEGKTLGERMLALRRTKGWTIREAASQLEVDVGTWGRWERNIASPKGQYRLMLNKFFLKRQL
ncbi:MAG TPA: helix-turn-helix transcriptional regulator [Rhodocyclaceae bacterium]|nr:helix-turn-helix transcriptional regulator [Rhodocyclaceae bacterium]